MRRVIELNISDLASDTFNPDGFEGSIKLEKPTVEQALNAQSLAIKLQEAKDGNAVMELLDWSKPFYKEVSISMEGFEYKSFEDLMDDASCLALLVSAAGKLINGVVKKPKLGTVL